MNKAVFMERLCRFDVPAHVVQKYYRIYEQISDAEKLSADEVKMRAERIAFVGYISCGNRLLTVDSEIAESYRRGEDKLCLIPYASDANLIGLHVARRCHPAPSNLKQIGIIRVYKAPDENGVPRLTITDVVSQLSVDDVKKAKAFALHLNDEFVETGYLHLAQVYEFQIELFA